MERYRSGYNGPDSKDYGSLVSSCQKKQGISRLFRCVRSHFHKICLPVILHFSGSGKNPVFTAYRRLNIKLIKYLWSGIEAVITRTTRNRLTAKNRPWVRIPPAPPQTSLVSKAGEVFLDFRCNGWYNQHDKSGFTEKK